VWSSDVCSSDLQERLVGRVSGGRSLVVGQLAASGDMADEAVAERDEPAENATARAGFSLDKQFACRVFKHADADVIVSQPGFELLRNLGQHFVWIECGDGVAGNRV